MIINSLLFVIVCIFVYETFNILTKMTEEYFSNLEKEQFVSLGSDPDKNDISKTIAINCKLYPTKSNSLMLFKPESDESLDTPFYAQFKPLKYNPKRKYYWRSNKLVQEGKRRSMDDEDEIEKVQTLLENETDPDKQLVYQEELNLSNWRNNILDNKDSITELDRGMRDITSDYFPDEIGMNRPWIERHSHIPDYSY
jgi:hypothetical protein